MSGLDERAVSTLREMAEGGYTWGCEQFIEAYLEDHGYVEPDYDTISYTLTEKGVEALAGTVQRGG